MAKKQNPNNPNTTLVVSKKTKKKLNKICPNKTSDDQINSVCDMLEAYMSLTSKEARDRDESFDSL